MNPSYFTGQVALVTGASSGIPSTGSANRRESPPRCCETVQPGASFIIGVALPVDGGYTALASSHHQFVAPPPRK